MAMNIDNSTLRENFRVALNSLAAANNLWKDVGGKRMPDIDRIDQNQVTQGYVVTEANLLPNTSVVQFPIVDTQQIANAPITPTMQLLAEQDSFCVGSMCYDAFTYSFTGGNQANIDFTTGNNWRPVTYNSAWTENGSSPSFGPGTAILWLGYLSFEVNKKVLIPFWDCARHYLAPRTQATPGTLANTTNGYLQSDCYDGATDGYYPVEPIIILGGGRQNTVKLNLPANIPSTVAPFSLGGVGYGTYFICKARLRFRGILMQNSTNVK